MMDPKHTTEVNMHSKENPRQKKMPSTCVWRIDVLVPLFKYLEYCLETQAQAHGNADPHLEKRRQTSKRRIRECQEKMKLIQGGKWLKIRRQSDLLQTVLSCSDDRQAIMNIDTIKKCLMQQHRDTERQHVGEVLKDGHLIRDDNGGREITHEYKNDVFSHTSLVEDSPLLGSLNEGKSDFTVNCCTRSFESPLKFKARQEKLRTCQNSFNQTHCILLDPLTTFYVKHKHFNHDISFSCLDHLVLASMKYLEIAVNNINKLFILTLGKSVFISKYIFNAWLLRSTLSSLEYRTFDLDNLSFLRYILIFLFDLSTHRKSLDVVTDSTLVNENIMSDSGPSVCIHSSVKHVSVSSQENANAVHTLSSPEKTTSPRIHQSSCNTTSNRRCQPIYGTVDLKSREEKIEDSFSSAFMSENNNDSLEKDDKKKEIIRSVICHGTVFQTDIVAAPVSGRRNKDSQHKRTKNNTNDSANGASSNEAALSSKEEQDNNSSTFNHDHSSANMSENSNDSLKTDENKKEIIRNLICHGTMYNTDIEAASVSGPINKVSHHEKHSENETIDNANGATSREAALSSKDEQDSISSTLNHDQSAETLHSYTSNQVRTDSFPLLKLGKHSFQSNGKIHQPSGNETDCCFSQDIERRSIGASARFPSNKNSNRQEEDSHSRHSGSQPSVIDNETGSQPIELPSPEVEPAEIQRFEPLLQVIDKMADGQRVPPQITMQYEMLRFCTLRSFPKENKPYITRLAQAGFYYANSGDELVCYCCARRKRNWCEDDKPMEIHRELNPNCSFLIRNAEVNVPIKTAENSLQNLTRAAHAQTLQNGRSDTLTSTITSGNSRHPSHETSTHTGPTSAVQNNSEQVNTIPSNRSQTRAHGNFVQATAASSPAQAGQLDQSSITRSSTESSLTAALRNAAEGVNTPAMPKYPKYASKTVRISSFNDCSDIVIPPDRLADAGFFYAGFGDCTRCFQCGAGLRHWSEEDDPWIEHSRWSKDCSFVRQIKGPEFVNIVQMAVQYSQNENEDEQTTGENPTGTNNNEANLGVNVDNLMHTDAAQSVLEMGYHPNLIRRAIRLIKEANGDANMTAANVMEKVFELEEADSSANEQQNDQPLQRSQNADLQTTTATPTVRATSDNMTRNHQRSAELTSHASISSSPSNSVAVDSTKSGSTQSGGKEMTRAQKKMQLLEQKKLKEENKKLKQQSICTKCHQNDVCIVFLPCGHLVTCETCAPTVRYCTVQGCGKYIKGTVRTYLA